MNVERLSRSGRLLEGESGHLLPFDALNGFVVFPFRNFFLRVKTLWYTLTSPFRGKERSKPETVIWTIVALLAAGLLFWLALRLLAAGPALSRADALVRHNTLPVDANPAELEVSKP